MKEIMWADFDLSSWCVYLMLPQCNLQSHATDTVLSDVWHLSEVSFGPYGFRWLHHSTQVWHESVTSSTAVMKLENMQWPNSLSQMIIDAADVQYHWSFCTFVEVEVYRGFITVLCFPNAEWQRWTKVTISS